MPAAVSHKALHRPGKVPSTSTLTASFPSTHAKGNNARPKMARNDSIVSLPSPPMEERFSRGVENELDEAFGLGGSRRDQFADSPGTAASSDSEGLPVPHSSNPFLRPQPQVQQRQETYRPAQPDHPQSSPTQARRRVSKEAITLRPAAVVEMAKQAGGEVDSWNDADNPFVVRPGDAQKRWVSGKAPRPEKLTYVFRGKRITYDIPFSALMGSPSSPSSPTSFPSSSSGPRLLFPPTPITPPSTSNPSSAFLDALRSSVREDEEVVGYGKRGRGSLPTPVTEKRGKVVGGAGRYGPYKKMRHHDE